MLKKSFLIMGFCALLANGCSSTPTQQSTALQTTSIPSTSSETQTPAGTIAPTGIAPSTTASPPPSPTPTPTASPPGINAGNFADLAIITQYLPGLQRAVAGFQQDYALDALAISPDGRLLAIGGCTASYRFSCPNSVLGHHSFLAILSTDTANVISILPETDTTITGLGFSPDSSQLIYATYPQRVVVWDISGETVGATLFKNDQANSKIRMRVSPDGSSIAVSSVSNLMILERTTGKLVKELPTSGFVPHYSADGSRLAMFSQADGSEISVYDTASWQEISQIQYPVDPIYGNSLDISTEGAWIVTYSDSDEPIVRLWDANTGEQIDILETPSGRVLSSEFSPNGQLFFISISSDLEVVGITGVWDVHNWKPLGELRSYSENGTLLFDSKGEFMLASNGRDIWRWGTVDEQILQSRQTVVNFFDALSQGDFLAAAAMYQPDEYEIENLQASGFDTSDLVNLLEQICAGGSRICLPVLRVLPGSGLSTLNNYEVFVEFQSQDGSPFISTYGISAQYVIAGMDSEGNWKVNFIPYNE